MRRRKISGTTGRRKHVRLNTHDFCIHD